MSVHQINGHWYYRFTINGIRYRKAIKEARTKRQAERAEQVAKNEVFERRWGESGQRFFEDFVDNAYVPHAQSRKKGFNVERSILSVLKQTFGRLRLFEVTSDRVEQFQQQRATEKTNRNKLRSRATVNRDVAVLSAIFKLALRLGEVKENPVSKIQYFGNLPKRDRVLSDEEEITLLKGISSDPDLRSKVEILLYTGLRRSELFRLEWRDINLTNGVIVLRKETTKTGRSRKISILSNVRKILSDLSTQAKDNSPTSQIFNGGESVERFSARLKDACEKLGIENITAHSLRHTYSTRANRFGVDPFAQRDALGHAKLSQTADYTHQSNETFRRNFEPFEAHLRQINDKI